MDRRATTSRAASWTNCTGALKWITPRAQGFGSGFARDYQAAWANGSGLGSIVGARASACGQRRDDPPTGSRCVGQSVFHTKFGEGVIVTLEGRGTDARAQINFGRHGTKWLALSVAKLTPIGLSAPCSDGASCLRSGR